MPPCVLTGFDKYTHANFLHNGKGEQYNASQELGMYECVLKLYFFFTPTPKASKNFPKQQLKYSKTLHAVKHQGSEGCLLPSVKSFWPCVQKFFGAQTAPTGPRR